MIKRELDLLKRVTDLNSNFTGYCLRQIWVDVVNLLSCHQNTSSQKFVVKVVRMKVKNNVILPCKVQIKRKNGTRQKSKTWQTITLWKRAHFRIILIYGHGFSLNYAKLFTSSPKTWCQSHSRASFDIKRPLESISALNYP